MARSIASLSLSWQIAIGLAAGLLLGIFLGEYVAPVNVIANGYILLLQMTVLPYIVVSLVAGLGSLTAHQARMMFTKVGLILLLLWSMGLVFVFLMPLTFPRLDYASFFSTSLIEQRPHFDFLSLYIPANPFHALANNVVPAVVVFSVVLGIALIPIENKQQFLSFLSIMSAALSSVTRFVVRLAPIGLFAIAAELAGTLRLEELQRVQIYMIAFGALALLLMLWVIPALIATLTTVRYKDVLKVTRDALITAFMTGDLLVVLPILSEASRMILKKHLPENLDTEKLPDVIVPASFNFPHSGKILSISFILFAAWFSDTSFSPTDHLTLPFIGILSFFGNLTVAVPYLLDEFRIPIDTFQLFLATGLINSRFGSAVAAMHTFGIAVLGACAMSGAIVVKPGRIIRFILATSVLVVLTLLGLRMFFDRVIDTRYTQGNILRSMQLTRKTVDAVVVPKSGTSQTPDRSNIDLIRSRGYLRIGYFEENLPFTYLNDKGELIGLDVDLAHQLAGELSLSLQFVLMDRSNAEQQINAGRCDILMSGYSLTTDRAQKLGLTTPYLDQHLAFLVPDYRRKEFVTHEAIRQQRELRIGVPDVPYYARKLEEYAPEMELVTIQLSSRLIENSLDGLDAVAITAEQGSSWSLLYPQYSIVVPQPDVLTIPVTFAVGRTEQELLAFLNSWLELKKKDGTVQQLYDYWILGKNIEARQPRWSIVQNVLNWLP